MVQEVDALLVSGGDSLYLAHWMRESGLADLQPSLGAVWASISAGSMVMGPRIGEHFKYWSPPGGGDEALGIVDFSIFHLDHPDLAQNTMADAERWAASLPIRPTRSTTTADPGGRRRGRGRLRGELEAVRRAS